MSLIIAALLAATVGLTTYLLTRQQCRSQLDDMGRQLADARTASSASKADFDGRQQELRSSISEARARENEAKGKLAASERACAEITDELKVALEERAHFQ